MAGRTTGRFAKIYMALGHGASVSNAALTLSASKEIQGVTYTSRFYGYSGAIFNRAKALTVRIQGIVGAMDLITPASGNNVVQTPAFSYYKDASTIQSVSADTSVTVVRPAAGKFNWNLITVNTGTNAVSATTGTDGGAYSDTFAAGGGPPLVAVDEIIIGAVKLSSDAAAPIVAGDIFYSDSTGVLLQERSDIPGYELFPVEGGILTGAALGAFHTGPVGRKVYASFYDLAPVIAEVAHTDNVTLNTTSATTSAEAFNDISPQTDLSGSLAWSGSLGRFYVGDSVLFSAACDRRTGVIKYFPNYETDSGKYYIGCVIYSGFDHVGPLEWVKNTVNFQGDGNLKAVGF